MWKTIQQQVIATVVTTALCVGVGWSLGSYQESARVDERIIALQKQVDATVNQQRAIEQDVKVLYEMKGSLERLTQEISGLRDDIRSIRPQVPSR